MVILSVQILHWIYTLQIWFNSLAGSSWFDCTVVLFVKLSLHLFWHFIVGSSCSSAFSTGQLAAIYTTFHCHTWMGTSLKIWCSRCHHGHPLVHRCLTYHAVPPAYDVIRQGLGLHGSVNRDPRMHGAAAAAAVPGWNIHIDARCAAHKMLAPHPCVSSLRYTVTCYICMPQLPATATCFISMLQLPSTATSCYSHAPDAATTSIVLPEPGQHHKIVCKTSRQT